jgi:ABC-type arginine transport system ATPase subunit
MATYAELNAVWQAASELIDLRGTRDLTGPDINKVTISLDTAQGIKVISFAPGDQGWAGLLSGLNTMVTNKTAALKTVLQNFSITELPE